MRATVASPLPLSPRPGRGRAGDERPPGPGGRGGLAAERPPGRVQVAVARGKVRDLAPAWSFFEVLGAVELAVGTDRGRSLLQGGRVLLALSGALGLASSGRHHSRVADAPARSWS